MKLGYVIIYVPDLTAALDFYERAFGFERRFEHESGYGELISGDTTLAFSQDKLAESHGGPFRPNRPGELPAGFEIALVTDDVAAAFEQAVSAGAVALHPPETKPWGQVVAYVRDLNGVLVELCTAVG